MATINGDLRNVGGYLVAGMSTAGVAVWCLVMDTQEERIHATVMLDLTLQKVTGADLQVVYYSASLREVETFKDTYFPD